MSRKRIWGPLRGLIAGGQRIRHVLALSPAPRRSSAMRNLSRRQLAPIRAGKLLGLRFPH